MLQLPSIDTIYDRYQVPNNLRQHLYAVAAIGELISDHWSGPTLRRDQLRRVLLLHDIGNIVKMDEAEGELAEIKRKTVEKYGSDDHVVSRAIAAELGFSNEDLDLMDQKVFVRNDETADGEDYTRKVGAYADQRVAPDGVRPLMDRLLEAKERYRDKPGSSMNNHRTDMLIRKAEEIEYQLTVYCPLVPHGIMNEAIRPIAAELRVHKIVLGK